MRRPPWRASFCDSFRCGLTGFLSCRYGPLLWFFQEGSGGPGVARLGSTASCKQGGIVSQRTAAALLAVLTLTVTLGPIHAGAQTAQSEEMLRRAKSKVQPDRKSTRLNSSHLG